MQLARHKQSLTSAACRGLRRPLAERVQTQLGKSGLAAHLKKATPRESCVKLVRACPQDLRVSRYWLPRKLPNATVQCSKPLAAAPRCFPTFKISFGEQPRYPLSVGASKLTLTCRRGGALVIAPAPLPHLLQMLVDGIDAGAHQPADNYSARVCPITAKVSTVAWESTPCTV